MSNSLFRKKRIESILAEGGDDAHATGLKRVLSVRDLTFFGIAAIIGAGSFSSLGEAVYKGGPGVVLLFIITGIACGFTAFCYSEFASRIPVAGSAYTYSYASFGELFAWIIGWALIMEYSIGNIYVAFSWSDYFTGLLKGYNINVPEYFTMDFLTAKRGFAEKEGLKLELLEVKDDQIGLKALLSGELDSYEGGAQGAIAVNVRGGDVKIMGCHWVVVPHGIMAKAGIDKIEDLKGRAVAVSAPGSFPDMLARLALAKFKIAPSEVKLAAVGGDRDRYTALVGGVVDAAVVSNEYLPLESSKGLKMLLEGKDALPNFLRICMFSSAKVLAERREDAIRFLTAQSKALRYALGHRDETVALTVEATAAKANDPRPAFVFDDAVKVGAIAPDLPLPMDKLSWMQDQMVELGQIPKAGDLAKMVNNDIRAQAVERAGK